MQLLPNEQILLGNDSTPLCLTTLRVRSNGRDWGKASIQQIFLEDVCFVGMTMVSTPLLLIAAVLSGVTGIIYLANQNNGGSIGLFAGIVLLLAYFGSRRQVLTFASAGGRISLQASKMKYEHIVLCLDTVSARKNDRYLRQYPSAPALAA